MKYTLVILLSVVILSGCSKKQATPASQAIDLVVAGKDIAWRDGYVLHVTKRDGSSLEGITISGMRAGSHNQTMLADTGTVAPGVTTNGTSDSSVIIDLHFPKVRVITDSSNYSETTIPYKDYPIELRK
jgi:hypothetical protein